MMMALVPIVMVVMRLRVRMLSMVVMVRHVGRGWGGWRDGRFVRHSPREQVRGALAQEKQARYSQYW